ncbi:MAG: stage III sporulation protein AA [Sarcina sp.]
MHRVLKVLPKEIESLITADLDKDTIEEIRVSIGKQVRILKRGKEEFKSYKVTAIDIKNIIQKISNYSLYAIEEELKQGYITIEGGHRVGVAGQCIIENNSVKTIKNISSLNIRIAREILGCSNKLIDYIVNNGQLYNTLIVSPPKCGKTTLLRDLSRNISNGVSKLNFDGKRVVIIDERSEIASCYKGVPQMNVGERTDVYDNCVKEEGIMMAIRTMSPEVVICDEIGSRKDIEGLISAANSGVSIICTLHGNGIEDLYKRENLKIMLEENLIKKVIVLSSKKGAGSIEGVYDV